MDAEQARPTPPEEWRNDLATPPPADHNAPPERTLAEALIEETAPLKAEIEKLLAGAERAYAAMRDPLKPDEPPRITDRETAERATLLAGMMIDHGKAIEAERERRGAPFLAATRTVNRHFEALRADLVGADLRRLGGAAGRIKRLVADFYDEEDRKAEAEKRRIEAEARRAAEAAAEAERQRQAFEAAARAAALEGDVRGALAQSGARVEAEVRVQQLTGDVRRLTQQAEQTLAAPIKTGYGVSAHRTVRYKAEITNLPVALRHALKLNKAVILAAVQDIYDRQARAGIRSLPGANVVPDPGIAIRTR